MAEPGPSATARMIAAAQVLAHAEGWRPAPSPAAVAWSRRFLHGNGDRWLLRSVDSPWGRRCWRLVERWSAPALIRHFLRRKAWIDQRCRELLGQGATQLLILGAGLDSLGLRWQDCHRDLAVYEVDTAATVALRQRCVGERAGWQAIGGDLVDVANGGATWQALARALDPTRTSAIVCEGVAMYLPFPIVRRLLQRLAGHLQVATLIVTVMENEQHPVGFRPYRAASTQWLRARGEPFRWGLGRGAAAPVLASCGWRLIDAVHERDLAYRWPGPVIDGETILVAEPPRLSEKSN